MFEGLPALPLGGFAIALGWGGALGSIHRAGNSIVLKATMRVPSRRHHAVRLILHQPRRLAKSEQYDTRLTARKLYISVL